MLTPDALAAMSDEEVVCAAQAFLETQDRHNLRVLLRCSEPQKIAGHIRTALKEAFRQDARESFATPAPALAPQAPPDPATTAAAKRKAQAMLDRMSPDAIRQAATRMNMTVDAYREHLLGKFKMGFLG